MTDEQMDARLRGAGERWRSAETTVAEVSEPAGEFDLQPRIARPHPARRWLAFASAAAIVAAAAVATAVVATHRGVAPATTSNRNVKLVGHPWALAANPSATVFFTDDTIHYTDGCDNGTHPVRITATSFTVDPRKGSGSACGKPSPGAPRQNPGAKVDFGGVFVGTANWSIAGDRLTVTKRGVGSVGFVAVDNAAASTLDGVDWRVTAMTDGTGHPVAPSAGMRIQFLNGTLTAVDGCNTLSGAVAIAARRIMFGVVATTAIGCADGARSTHLFDAIVVATASFTVHDNTLTLAKSGVGRITFQPFTVRSAEQLVGVAWRLTGTEQTQTSGNSASGSGSSAIGSSVVRFDGNGGVQIEHRCDTYSGTARLGRRAVTISDVRLFGSGSCAGRPNNEAAEQHEDELVNRLLTGSLAWSVDGGTLTLTKGGASATFVHTRR